MMGNDVEFEPADTRNRPTIEILFEIRDWEFRSKLRAMMVKQWLKERCQ